MMRRPEDVFASQLQATRLARDLTLRELARLMREAGFPKTSRDAVARLEAGRYRVHLNEALAFAELLNVSLAHLLTPGDGKYLAPTRTRGYSGRDMRSWLATAAAPPYVMPAKRQMGEELTDDERAQLEQFYLQDLAMYAHALFVATLAGAPEDELGEATRAFSDRVQRRHDAVFAAPDAMPNRARAEADARDAWPTVLRWLRTGTTAEPLPPLTPDELASIERALAERLAPSDDYASDGNYVPLSPPSSRVRSTPEPKVRRRKAQAPAEEA